MRLGLSVILIFPLLRNEFLPLPDRERRIRKPLHQALQLAALHRRPQRPRGGRQLAQCHGPEVLRRQAQYAQSQPHCLRPGKAAHAPKVACNSLATMAMKPAAPPAAVMAATSSSLT